MKKILIGAFLCSSFASISQTYTFTTAGANGRFGPTQLEVNAAYTATTLDGLVTITVQGVQEWTVPTTGIYQIQAVGAVGGNSTWAATVLGGNGSDMTGEFNLTAGQVISIVVGQSGETAAVGGGGGGSYVASSGAALIVAGGGGGASSDQTGVNAVITENGTMCSMNVISGGTLGNGGNACTTGTNNGGGGGGFFTDGVTPNTGGTNNNGFGGLSFLNGSIGGLQGRMDGACSGDPNGSFGGGGSGTCNTVGGGGGGGYSGGAGGQHYGNCGGGSVRAGGGGGGSYNIGTNVLELAGTNTGDGSVIITSLCAPTSIVPDSTTLLDVNDQCTSSPTAPTATTDCGNQVIGVPDVTLPITTPGTTIITWTFDAGGGISTTQSQNVILTDNTAPVPDSTMLLDVMATCSVDSAAVAIPTATDSCQGTIWGTPDLTFPVLNSTTITWTFDDGGGNISTQTQNIVITDNIPPVPDSTQLTAIIGCGPVSPVPPTATDNCSSASVTGTPDVTFPITASGLTVVTWTYDDGNGNTTTQTQNVNVTILDLGVTEAGFILTATASGATYQWLDCDNAMSVIPGEIGQTFAASSTGNYAVEITENGCVDTSACTLIDFSVLNSLANFEYSVYPNPTDGLINLEFSGSLVGNLELKVIDIVGRVIVQKVLKVQAENLNEVIDISQHESGAYIIVVTDENGASYSTRIVKK